MYLESETIPYGHGRSFASIVFEGPSIICPYHRHPEIELVAIDAGRGRIVAGDCMGTFRNDEIFLLGEDLPHIFQSARQAKGESMLMTNSRLGAGFGYAVIVIPGMPGVSSIPFAVSSLKFPLPEKVTVFRCLAAS